MDPCIFDEALLLSREYSALRHPGLKWVSKTKKSSADEKVWVSKDSPICFITVQRGDFQDTYKASSLFKRNLIRRSRGLLRIFQQLWEMVNPLKIAGISEKVYLSLFAVAFSQTKRENFENLDRNLALDKRVDFKGRTWLSFADLYDSLFEFLDTYTKSPAGIEYICLLKSITAALQDQKWANSLNLCSKLHVPPDARPFYSPWMIPVLRASEKRFNREEIPVLIRVPLDVQVSERLLRRKTPKPVDRENFNVKKLEQMMKMQLVKEFKQNPRSSTQHTARPRFLDKKTSTFYNPGNLFTPLNDHLAKISPLSCVLKQSRSKPSILEKVIDGRKTLNFKVLSQKDLLRD